MTRPSRVLLPVVVVALALAAAGCSGGSSGKDAAAKRTTTTAAPGATTAVPTTAAAGAATTVPGPTTTTKAKCKAGLGTVAGVQARTFCGPATATVTVGTAAPLAFAGGQCQSGAGYLTVNIGTVALGALKDPSQKPAYFGLVAGDLSKAPGGAAAAGDPASPPIAGDGAYPGQPVITGNSGATAIVMKTAALTLSDGQKQGSFTGTGLDGQPVSGSFACT